MSRPCWPLGTRETLDHVIALYLALLGYGAGEWLSTHLTLWSQHADLLGSYAAVRPDAPTTQDDTPGRTLIGVVAWGRDLVACVRPSADHLARAQALALLFLRHFAQFQAEWGILTNGQRWRLYARGDATLEASYEVDLPMLAASDDVGALRFFWLFFTATAHRELASDEPSFLETALRESGSDEQLRFDRAYELATADALIAAVAQGGAPLGALELMALHTAHREARDTLAASQREREATTALIDLPRYHLYRVEDDECGVIAGGAVPGKAADRAAQPGADGVSYGNQSQRRSIAGAVERSLPQEVQSEMRVISKGGRPDMLARCVAQALTQPYSGDVEMNLAMGYAPLSSVGPHYLNTAILAGLLTETTQGWLRPTRAGRCLALDSGRGSVGAVWDALLTLPAYRRYLEYKILTIVERDRSRSALEIQQVESAAYEAFPAFRSRAEYLRQMLALGDLPPGRAITALRDAPALEPLSYEATRAWVSAQGLGPQRTHVSRAGEIAQTLARAAQIPLTVRSEWLESMQLLALLLLIAARQRGQGIALPPGAGRGAAGLGRAVESLQHRGIDIRLEPRGQGAVATLTPAIMLRIASAGALDPLLDARVLELAELAHVVSATIKASLRTGLDGQERGEMAPAELASRWAEVASEGVGEFVNAAAAEEMTALDSTITVGAPLPLASDLPLLGREYRFLAEAIRGHDQRGWRGGVAALLSEWGTRQRDAPDDTLAVNPHLALLYLIAADTGERVSALKRLDAGWWLGDVPLVAALDDRLHGLGYEVWDEGYRTDESRMQALGFALVEQGLRVGVLKASGDPALPLDAPSAYGYYEAVDLLTVEPARRTAR